MRGPQKPGAHRSGGSGQYAEARAGPRSDRTACSRSALGSATSPAQLRRWTWGEGRLTAIRYGAAAFVARGTLFRPCRQGFRGEAHGAAWAADRATLQALWRGCGRLTTALGTGWCGSWGAKRRREGGTGVSARYGGFDHLYFPATCHHPRIVSSTRSCSPLAGIYLSLVLSTQSATLYLTSTHCC